MKLYDYTTGALVEVTLESLADDYVMAHFIPQVPSAFALYAVLRAEQESRRSSDNDLDNRRERVLMTIRLVALTALPGGGSEVTYGRILCQRTSPTIGTKVPRSAESHLPPQGSLSDL